MGGQLTRGGVIIVQTKFNTVHLNVLISNLILQFNIQLNEIKLKSLNT